MYFGPKVDLLNLWGRRPNPLHIDFYKPTLGPEYFSKIDL